MFENIHCIFMTPETEVTPTASNAVLRTGEGENFLEAE